MQFIEKYFTEAKTIIDKIDRGQILKMIFLYSVRKFLIRILFILIQPHQLSNLNQLLKQSAIVMLMNILIFIEGSIH